MLADFSLKLTLLAGDDVVTIARLLCRRNVGLTKLEGLAW